MESLLTLLQPKKIILDRLEESQPSSNNSQKPIALGAEQSLAFRLMCVNVAISAFQSYSDQDYMQFDALVGENACQIRASMLQEMILSSDLNPKLAGLIAKLEKIREKLLSGLPEEEDALDKLTFQHQGLILSRLLNCTRDPLNKLRTNELMLRQFCPDKSLREDVLVEVSYHAKRCLSQASLKYVRSIESNLVVKKMLGQTENANKGGIQCSALLYNMEGLMENLKSKHNLLMLNIGGEYKLVFRSNETGELQRIDNPSELDNEPVFVVYYKINEKEALSSIIAALEKNENDFVTRFILADSADHPLFTGKDNIEKKMKIFQHEKVHPFIKGCKGETLEEINEKLNQLANQKLKLKEKTVYQKDINIANAACSPISLAEVILAHRQYKLLKAEGKVNKQVVQIIHIYCNTLKKELDNEGDILKSSQEEIYAKKRGEE